MSKLRVASFSISIDGFGAGPEQSLENPLGFGGAQLHAWAFPTRTLRRAVFGAGERLFEEIDLRALGYACNRHVASEHATHVILERSPRS